MSLMRGTTNEGDEKKGSKVPGKEGEGSAPKDIDPNLLKGTEFEGYWGFVTLVGFDKMSCCEKFLVRWGIIVMGVLWLFFNDIVQWLVLFGWVKL